MTNRYSELSLLESSERFYLCRIAGLRYVGESLTDLGGNLYTCKLNDERPLTVFRGPYKSGFGTGLDREFFTKVNTTPTNDKEYQIIYDSIYFYSIKNADTICLSFELYFSSKDGIDTYSDPYSKTGNVVFWRNNILKAPTISESIENISSGLLTINTSTLEIENTDEFFSSFNNQEYSFFRQTIELWSCIDTVENIKKLFKGIITDINQKNDSVSFKLSDFLGSLDTTYTTVRAGDLINLHPQIFNMIDEKRDDFIREFRGSCPYQFDRLNYNMNATIRDRINFVTVDLDSMFEGICSDYSTEPTGTNNRVYLGGWGSEALDSNGTHELNIDAIISVDPSDYYHIFAGDALIITASGTDYYCIVKRKLAGDTGFRFFCTPARDSAGSLLVSTGFYPIKTKEIPCVGVIGLNEEVSAVTYDYFLNANEYICADYTNYLSRIILGDNIESNLTTTMERIDPSRHKVVFRTRKNLVQTGSLASDSIINVIKDLLEYAGIEINEDSFEDIADLRKTTLNDVDIPQLADIYLPVKDDESVLKTLERLLRSCFCALYLDDDLKVGIINLEDTTSATDIYEYNIINDSLEQSTRYRDQKSSIKLVPEFSEFAYGEYQDSLYDNQTFSSKKTYSLLGEEDVREIEIVSTYPANINDIVKSQTNFHMNLSLSVEQKFNFLKVGENVTLKDLKNVPINKKMKVMSITRNNNFCQLELSDIGIL
jgi:hypothetical protein